MSSKSLSLETCREIAARIWGDKEYSHIDMDANVADNIASILYEYANKAPKPGVKVRINKPGHVLHNIEGLFEFYDSKNKAIVICNLVSPDTNIDLRIVIDTKYLEKV